MRILKVTDVYFPRINGVSTSIQTFRREFLASGHRVTLIAPNYDGQPCEDDDDVIRIPSRQLPVDPEDRMMRLTEIKKLSDELKHQDYDVIHIHTPFVAHYAGLHLGRELGLPVVESYHTFFEEYFYNYIRWLPRSWLRALARSLSRVQCNKVNSIVVPSQPMFDVLRRYGVQRHMDIIPTGINLAEPSGGDGQRFRAEHGIDPARKTMLYVGRVAYEKNIAFLLDVLVEVRQTIPDVLLILAGEGPALERLTEQVRAGGLHDNVLFVGYLDRGQPLNDCYCAGDVFVFASATETQGLVLLEAMALGVPVVSTAVMGTADVLDNGYGCQVAEQAPHLFADTVCDVLTNNELHASLVSSASIYAREWSAGEMASRMLKLYERVVDHYTLQSTARQFRPGTRGTRAVTSDSRSR